MSFSPSRALITGASSGIGAVFADVLAARGVDLVLVARRRDRLEATASDLRSRHGVTVSVIAADLSVPGAGRTLLTGLDGPAPDLVINAAGFGSHGLVADLDPDRLASEIALNVGALVDITRGVLPGMIAAGTGAIVNVASTASFQPVPGMAVYAATKGFVARFTEALAYETRGTGVRVMTLSPGATRTEFFDVMGTSEAAVGTLADPRVVVDRALAALGRRRPPTNLVIGRMNALSAVFARIMPTRLVMPVAAGAVNAPRAAAAAE